MKSILSASDFSSDVGCFFFPSPSLPCSQTIPFFFADPQWINVDHLGCNNSHRCYHQVVFRHGMLCCELPNCKCTQSINSVCSHISLLLAVPAFLSCQTRCQTAAGHKRFNDTIDVCFWDGFGIWFDVFGCSICIHICREKQ